MQNKKLHFELLTRSRKIKSYTSKKKTTYFELLTRKLNLSRFTFEFISLQVTNSMIKYLFFLFRVTNSMVELLFSHVTNLKLINEKNSLDITVWLSVNPWKSILLLRFLTTSYDSMSRIAQACSNLGVTLVWFPSEENLYLFRGYIPLGSRNI